MSIALCKLLNRRT